MSFEEEFDRIIRQKAEDAKFTFSDENWQKASRLIDAERSSGAMLSSKKHLVYGAIGIIVVGAAIVAALYLDPSNESEATAIVIQNTNQLNNNDEQERNAAPLGINSVTHTNSSSSESLNRSEGEGSDTHVDVSNSKVSAESLSKGTKYSKEKSFEAPSSNPLEKEINAHSNDEVISKGVIPNIEANEIASAALVENSKTKEDLQDASDFSNDADQSTIEQMTLYPSYIVAFESKDEMINGDIHFLERYEQDYYKKGARTKSYFIDLEAGANYLIGWKVNGTEDAKGFNWFGGINFGYYLSNKFALGLGTQLYTIQNIQQPYYMNTERVYSFGSIQSQTVITCNTLLYASMPLKVYYELNRNSLLGLGINTGFLLAANNTVVHYDLSDNTKFNTTTEQVNGVFEGMSSINAMLTASFLQQINRNLAIEAEVNYGLNDLFMDTDINPGEQRSSGFRIGINYRICTK